MGNTCQDEITLSAFMDDALSDRQAQTVRRHIAECHLCRQRLTDLMATDEMVQKLDDIAPSTDFERTFWNKVDELEEHRKNRWWNRWAQPIWRPALATGLAAGFAIGLFMLTGKNNGIDIEDRFIAENIEMLDDYDLLHNLEILENWDAINAMKELS